MIHYYGEMTYIDDDVHVMANHYLQTKLIWLKNSMVKFIFDIFFL